LQALIANRSAPGSLEFRSDYPEPAPASDEVKIRVRYAGICSTDLEIVRGYMDFRGVPGHEFVGDVVSGPAELLGRRVVAEINCAPTGSPALPDEVRKHLPQRTVLGIAGRDGAFAEFVTVPAQNCHVVPDSIDDREAVFVEPLAAACQVLRDHPVRAETRASVIGTGRLGILCAQVLAATGCRLEVLGRNPATMKFCRARGLTVRDVSSLPDSPDRDLVVDCTGSPDGLRLALRLVRPRGTIVLKSTYARPPTIDLTPIVIHEITLAGNRCGPFPEALSLLERRQVDVASMVSAVYPLSRGVEAFAAADDPGRIKVILQPGRA
jgi:threonine dehydrogenase-like Zn-dependent dehydrogenase